jgi:peptidoglycan/xylan/chitin deacetylase (PgdA/CDA1 family)
MYIVRPPYLLKRLYPSAIWRKDSTQKKIYLTFDDGPVPAITQWVLNILKQQNIKATFFCVGENVVKHPEVFQQILNEKHSVGNHTYNHLNGWNTHTGEYIQNIEKCAEVVSSKLFRPPYGRIKKSQISMLKSQYSIIMWDVLSGDYDKTITPEQCLKNSLGTIRNGSIVVFHDSIKAQKNLEYALPRFIEYAKKNGFEFESFE